MLTAKLNNGRHISLLEYKDSNQLKRMRNHNDFFCQGCNEQVMLKVGTKRRPHFAHLRNSNCQAYSESESEYHMNGKKQLYEWIKNQGIPVELEKYLPSIKQIPDLYFNYKKNNFAIEFQCATIPEEIFLKRTAGYKKQGIIPLWILGEKRIKQVSNNIIQVQGMDFLSIFSSKSNYNLYTYNPLNKTFQIYSNILPLSETHALFTKRKYHISKLSLIELLEPDSYHFPQYFILIWLKRKLNWRINMYRQTAGSVIYLKTYYYNQNLHFSLFPSEAGIPLRNQIFFQTPTYLWQAWILEFIKIRGLHHMFTINEVKDSIQKLVNQNILKIRQNPLVLGDYSRAIKEYVNALCVTGHLKKLSSTLFVIMKKVRYPKTIEEASYNDKETLEILKGFLQDGKNMLKE